MVVILKFTIVNCSITSNTIVLLQFTSVDFCLGCERKYISSLKKFKVLPKIIMLNQIIFRKTKM